MKFTSLSLLFAGLVPALTSAQTLEQKWNLEEPVLTILTASSYWPTDSVVFFEDSAALSSDNTLAKLYKAGNPTDTQADNNCKTESGDQNQYNGDYLVLTENGIEANPTVDMGATDTDFTRYVIEKQETVSVQLLTDGVQDDGDIFSEPAGGGNATIAFCLRYGLYTAPPGQAASYEVNFLESLVILQIDLTAGFNVTDIEVAPKDKLRRTANQNYELEAFQCSGKNANVHEPAVELTNTESFSQGDVITVCVQPNAKARPDDIYMKRIEEFTYVLLDDTTGLPTTTIQKAIDVNDAAAGERGTMYGLTNMGDCEGETTCLIETILFATFYTRQGTVTGNGKGTMQFGKDKTPAERRMLRADRALEEAAAAEGEFDVNFEINSNDAFQGASSASSCMTVLALFGSVAAALAL